jgi:hypothetical protein
MDLPGGQMGGQTGPAGGETKMPGAGRAIDQVEQVGQGVAVGEASMVQLDQHQLGGSPVG